MIKYLTEYKKNNENFGAYVLANNLKDAKKLAKLKKETIVGYIPSDCLDCESQVKLL